MNAVVRDAVTLVETEFRVRVRRVLGDRRKLVGTVSTFLLFGVFFPWLSRDGVVAFGADAAAGPVPLGPLGAAFTGLAIVCVGVGASTGFNQEAAGTVGPLVRTSVPPTAVSLARLGSELARGLSLFVLLGAVMLGFLWMGAGGPLVPAVVATGALPVLVAGLLVGRVAGDAARYANVAAGISLWVKAVAAVVLTVAFFVGTQALLRTEGAEGEGGLAAVSVPPFLPGTPMQAYAGVVTAPLGSTPTLPGTAVAAVTLTAIPLALVAAVRVETRLLFRASASETDQVSGTRGVPRPFTVGPAARVAWRYLLRTRRDPRILSHLMLVLFMGLGGFGNVIQDPGAIFDVGPAIGVIGGATLAGAAYCMNPLGDDVDQLPLLLTSADSTGVLLRGRALAGATLGLPLALGFGVPLAAVGESPLFAVWLAVIAVVLIFAGAGVALGIGAVAPKFEQYEYMSVERPHPSNYAIFGYLMGVLLTGGIGFVLAGRLATGAPGVLVTTALTVYLAVVGAAGWGGYVYANRRFDALTLDDF